MPKNNSFEPVPAGTGTPKRLIIYDLDGTLVDTREDITSSVQHMLKEMGAAPMAPQEIQRYVGRGLHHLVASALKSRKRQDIQRGAEIYRDYYAQHMMDHSRLYEGALDLLKFFEDRKQAVITNKPNPFTEDLLGLLGVSQYFTAIVAGDSEFPKKPDPSALRAILKREKIKAAEALFIGDSVIDIETARNAGVEIAVVLHGFSGEDELKSASPDLIARDFGELQAALPSKGW